MKSGVDFYQSLDTGSHEGHAITNEAESLYTNPNYCPEKGDYNETHELPNSYNKTDISQYTVLGAVCLNYTSNKTYNAPSPVIVTFSFAN